MNNMNLRRPNDCGCKTNYNANCNTNCNINCNTNCDNSTHKCNCNQNCDADSSIYNDQLRGMAIAMGYVPWQQWCKVYDLCKGLNRGTIFPPLDLPFYGCIPRGYFNDREVYYESRQK